MKVTMKKYLRPPRIAGWIIQRIFPDGGGCSILGDMIETYCSLADDKGLFWARVWFWGQCLKSLPYFLIDELFWRFNMFKNYLKMAFRFFWRDKGYSFLNTAGLAIGLACFAILMMWVQDEIGWDRFHENSSLIYRIESNSPAQPAPLGPHLKANYPEISEAVRFYFSTPLLVGYEDKAFNEDGFILSDPAMFEVFTIPFVAGNQTSALTDLNTVVLTEAAAKKYFGNENPLGRVLTVENRFQVRVTGIVKNMPQNSDLQFNILGEFRILGNFHEGYETHWGNHEYYTYARLAAGAEARTLIPKIARIIMDRDPDQPNPLTMTPLIRIHLWEGMDAGLKPDWAFVATDNRYLDTLSLTLVAGRNFPENNSVEELPYFIINQKAVEQIKVKDAVGTRFSLWGWRGTVIGVVKDFHFRPLREELRPLLMFVLPEIYYYVLVKIQPENGTIPEILAGIKDVWDEFVPGTPFSYEFLDTAKEILQLSCE